MTSKVDLIRRYNNLTETRRFLLNIVSPAILAVALFNITIFVILIPSMEQLLIERKKETIKELATVVHSELVDLNRQERRGLLLREKAQEQALEHIENLRYGAGKDYFWVTDMHPMMVMHPYRQDLNGKDVSEYSDPTGKKLFSEFVKEVKIKGEAYVDYLWQWNDDQTRIVPKLSFVKGFSPWGWVIGTGIYMDDVRDEISRMTQKFIWLSLIIALVTLFLLLYIAKQSFNLEYRRRKTEVALRESEEKYRLLVESSNEGVALTVNDRIVFTNQTLAHWLDADIATLQRTTIHEHVMAPSPKSDDSGIGNFPDYARLKKRDGDVRDVIMTQSGVTFDGRNAVIYTFKDISYHQKSEERLGKLLTELQTSLLMPNSPIHQLSTKQVECSIDTSIRKAVEIMCLAGSRAILVKTMDGQHVGIVTDQDLRERVLNRHLSTDQPIAQIMTAPLTKISHAAMLFEATSLFQELDIHHIVVTDDEGHTIGMIDTNQVLQTQRHPASILLKEIQSSNTPDVVAQILKNVPPLVKALLDNGARVEGVARILSSISDAVIIKLIKLAIEELGEPPCRFAFVVLGSVARGEQTLKTDQDNAIIYDDPSLEDEKRSADYFLKMGNMVCSWLDAAGYSYCKGDVMAKNPKWCQPFTRWKQYFSDCVHAENPNDLLDVNVFFDFRAVYGENEFISNLRRHLSQIVADNHVFFFHLAQTTLQYKPPISFFGNIQLETAADKSSGINIKSAMICLVNFARIYALKHKIDESGTMSRLLALLNAGLLVKSSYDELAQAFPALLDIRLKHQALQINGGKSPDNFVALVELTKIEQSMLMKIFSDILVFQSRLTRDFARTE